MLLNHRTSYKIALFLTILYSEVLKIMAVELNQKNTIKIQTTYSTIAQDYNIDHCIPELPDVVGGKIHSVATNGKCVNMYEGVGCKGSFVRYVGNKSRDRLYSPSSHRWVEDELVKKDLQVRSVGPCFDQCDLRNWDGAKSAPINVTMTDIENGNETRVLVDGDGCFLLSSPRQIWRSIKISGDNSSCVELHSSSSCGSYFTQFRPGYPNLDELLFWGLGPGGNRYAHLAVAVARCGSHCKKTVLDINPIVPKDIGINMVTFYDHIGYYGRMTNINLSEGCVTLNDYDYNIPSIRTYGQCVILYDEPGCVNKQGSYTLQSSGMSNEYYREKLLSHTIPILPKSLKLCGNSMVSDNHRSLTDGIENIKWGTDSDSLHSWIIVLIFFSLAFLICCIALCGAYTSHLFQRANYQSNLERFKEIYKL